MKALSNEHRLLILCHLSAADELSVGELVREIGLSQSALSQHLAGSARRGSSACVARRRPCSIVSPMHGPAKFCRSCATSLAPSSVRPGHRNMRAGNLPGPEANGARYLKLPLNTL